MADPAEAQILADPLANAYAKVWQSILDQQKALIDDPLNMAQRRRLREMQQSIASEMRYLDGQAKEWVEQQIPRAYGIGGVTGSAEAGGLGDFAFTQISQEAVQRLATGLYTDLLQATGHVNDSTKSLIRAIGKSTALQKAIQGRTAVQAGREMQRLVEAKGIYAVRYANDAKHGLAEYSKMAMRTVTGNAYNLGTLDGAAGEGVTHWQVFDGTDCGWEEHNSPTPANGRIVSMEEAQTYPLAHPNCRRSFGPRPDIRKKPTGQKAQHEDLGRPQEPTASPPPQTTLMSDAEAKRQLSLSGKYEQVGTDMRRANIPSSVKAPTKDVTAAAQKAWMVGPNDAVGSYPWSDYIRQAMARQRGVPEPPLMAAEAARGKLPDMSQVDNWAASFIKGIEKQTDTHEMLWRGGYPGEIEVDDVFDMTPASWSAHPDVATTYGSDVMVVRNAYGVTLNEKKFNLDDLEVVSGGTMRVVSIRTIHTRVDEYGDGTRIVDHTYRLIEVEQLERLPG